MRPRHKAAENPDSRGSSGVRMLASMRPRHKAAENVRDLLAVSVGGAQLQ